jgi:CRP-like cAMP-binding protein
MLFADLDLDAAAALLKAVSHSWYRPGQPVYHQGDKPSALYSVRQGIIKLSQVSPDGTLRIVRLVGPGAVIGLEALLDSHYQHVAEPLAAADLCRLPTATVRQLSTEQPQLYRKLMLQWQEQVNSADSHLLQLSTGTIRARMLNLLRILSSLCEKGGTDFVLPGNLDCAALVAARVESVSRVIAEFKRRGLLARTADGNWTLVPDVLASVVTD